MTAARDPSKKAVSFRAIPTGLFLKHLPRPGRVLRAGQFTAIEAFLSMHRDLSTHGRLLSQRAYARIWRRDRKWVKARVEEFAADPFIQEYADHFGNHLGNHLGDHLGDQEKGHSSVGKSSGSVVSGDQEKGQEGSQEGDQLEDRFGATTRKEKEKQTQRERAPGADAPLSHSAFSVLVLEERQEWSEAQAGAWLESNLPRIEDAVAAKGSGNRDAAIRSTVRNWARRERETPLSESSNASSAFEEIEELEADPKRRLARRRLAYRGTNDPSEELIRLEFEQFGETLGAYVSP